MQSAPSDAKPKSAKPTPLHAERLPLYLAVRAGANKGTVTSHTRTQCARPRRQTDLLEFFLVTSNER
jgi:hypothetical protein